MIARRLVATLALVALVGNSLVFASSRAARKAAPEGQAFTLTSLKHENAGALTRILVESSAPPLYTVFRPSDRLIIVELPGGEGSQLATEYAVKSSLVESVRVRKSSSAAVPGTATTRIEINVREFVRDRSTVSGNTLVIELTPNQAAGVQVYPAVVTNKPADPPALTPAPTAVKGPVKSVAAPERVQPQPGAAKAEPLRAATMIRAVRSEQADKGVRIVVDTDGAAKFKDFVLPDPWRVVVDITGVRSAFGNKTMPVGVAGVDRVRVGQPSADVVRVVLDTRSKVQYRVERDGAQLVILVGNATSSRVEKPVDAGPQPAAMEVKVAGQRVENENQPEKQAAAASPNNSPNLVAQTVKPLATIVDATERANSQQAGNQQAAKLPAQKPAESVKETITQTVPASYARTAGEAQRPPAQVMTPAPTVAMSPGVSGSNSSNSNATQASRRAELAFCDSGFTGGMISFDLRAGVDVRDMLRFISQEHGVNFIVDKSVGPVPVDIRVTDLPWNQVIESVLRANRLGAVCESNGRMIRIATLAAVKEEQEQQRAIKEEEAKQVPLVTKILRLKYARAAGSLGGTGQGASGRGGSGGASSSSSSSGGSGGGAGRGGLVAIAEKRLSQRGRIEMDPRTNSLIVTDLPEYVHAVEGIIAQLDKPEPQVEIEARIVIANRNFLRDIGSELAGANASASGPGGMLQTGAAQITPGVGTSLPTGQGGGGSSGGSGGDAGGGGSANKGQIGPNLLGPFASNAMRVGTANTVLSLTTGFIGTGILSLALSASERKGQIRIVASPRITAQDNQTAEIINGVQIPVQTVSNNTITTTFITAALRLEITPQIIEETGEVLMHVVAENNTVNAALATQLNGGTPGINTQSAESVVRVQDGGTTVMGGVNIDTESYTQNRTPGVSRIPLLGNMFKRKTTERSTDEILFFITPRIVRGDGSFGPVQRSRAEGVTNPLGPQQAAQQKKNAQANVVKGGQ